MILIIHFINYCTADEYDRHMMGRRHKGQIEWHRARRDEAEKCVFIKGFPNRTTDKDLTDYFGMFGEINKCVVDDKHKVISCKTYIHVNYLHVSGIS